MPGPQGRVSVSRTLFDKDFACALLFRVALGPVGIVLPGYSTVSGLLRGDVCHRGLDPPSKADRPTQAAADPAGAHEEPRDRRRQRSSQRSAAAIAAAKPLVFATATAHRFVPPQLISFLRVSSRRAGLPGWQEKCSATAPAGTNRSNSGRAPYSRETRTVSGLLRGDVCHRAFNPPSKADRPTQAAADPAGAHEEPDNQRRRHGTVSVTVIRGV